MPKELGCLRWGLMRGRRWLRRKARTLREGWGVWCGCDTFERPEGSFAARAFGSAMHAFLDVLTKRIAEGAEIDGLLREVRGWGGRIQAMLRGDRLAEGLGWSSSPAGAGRA